MTTTEAIVGCMLGTAVGDAIGLPAEGLSPRRQRRLFSNIDSHRLLFGRGMTSDDTEHTCLIANALVKSAGDEAIFEGELARGLRAWLLTMPPAAGLATLRAAVRLCLGIDPRHSGVFSAGNGPAMRSALIGVCFGHDKPRLRSLVRASTRITHTDPKAELAALSVAVAAYQSKCGIESPQSFWEALCAHIGCSSGLYLDVVREAVTSVANGTSTPQFAERISLGRGPSGYCLQSVPVALHAWLRHPSNVRAAVCEAVKCGGDTDTTAAIAGGIVGARVGLEGIPRNWREGILEWPGNIAWIQSLAARLGAVTASGVASEPMRLPYLPLLIRNWAFAVVVIGLGLRRLLPPY